MLFPAHIRLSPDSPLHRAIVGDYLIGEAVVVQQGVPAAGVVADRVVQCRGASFSTAIEVVSARGVEWEAVPLLLQDGVCPV